MVGRLADGVGFEPTEACAPPVFKTGAIDHSATHPSGSVFYRPIPCLVHYLSAFSSKGAHHPH
ncbi:hypothetical protein MCP1_20228 [Candidatus Terasakiella magnetica]|nr:hypothetical protein MCP1_20228 [Candidatus Terasakiella magnetica]